MSSHKESVNPPGKQDNLAERLELLEARIRLPASLPPKIMQQQHRAVDEVSLLTAMESPAMSQHSFQFDPPSNCSAKIVNKSMLSPKPATNSSHPSSAGRRSLSLEAVTRAAEQHLQKVAALESSRSGSRLSAGASSALSNSSFQTVKRSHTNSSNDNKVVKESPPTAANARNISAGSPHALKVSSGFPRNKKQTSTGNTNAKQVKRKSTPVKKDISSTKNDGTRRKRTRLQFSSSDSNDGQQQKLLSVGNTCNSRSPRTLKAPAKNRRINDFFTKKGERGTSKEQQVVVAAAAKLTPAPHVGTPIKSSAKAVTTPQSQGMLTPGTQVAKLQQSCRHWEQVCQEKEAQLKAVANNRTILQTAVQSALKQREAELDELQNTYSSYSAQVSTVLEDLMRQQALRDAQRLREQLAADGSRLGRIVYTRAGMRSVEAWEEGTASRQLQERRETLLKQLSELEERQRQAKMAAKLVLQMGDDKENKSTGPDHQPNQEMEGIIIKTRLDALEAVESVQLHLKTMRHKLDALGQQEKKLKEEKVEHIRTWKRLTQEDASRFRHRPKLHNRYVLMTLLGKGGFSEVWKAYDVDELQEVAVKIHQLDPRWSDEKKESYTKHVSREYEIHRSVRHPRIVSLLDVFEVDTNSFCTVLEYCSGTDLETILKQRTKLPERDARAILLQILSGMNYLSHSSPDGKRQAIIHYDLKPANILFSAQDDAKITDFGLSKIVEAHDPGQSMELTSQGAGTYWYLPPECFIMEEEVTVKISNKVDVWSIGVIYYQMLYGKRPFGHGQSQDRILSNHTMLNAKEVNFPAEPTVSVAGKAFITACLQYDQAVRPTVGQICENPYVTNPTLASAL